MSHLLCIACTLRRLGESGMAEVVLFVLAVSLPGRNTDVIASALSIFFLVITTGVTSSL